MITTLRATLATLTVGAMTLSPLAASQASESKPAIGSTISANAWERELDDFRYVLNDTEVFPEDGVHEYVYRIHEGDTLVDVQSTEGYFGLTAAEQSQWYEDAGLAPYEFNWVAFFCQADNDTSATLTDAGISLNEMVYVAADDLFPDAGRSFFDDYMAELLTPWQDMSIYGVEDPRTDLSTTVGYSVADWNDIVFSTSYADFSCPDGSTLVTGAIQDPANPDTDAVTKALTIPEVLTIEADSGDLRVNADGVFIGVTGQQYNLDFNAALWGMTQVDGELADTGVDSTAGVLALAGLTAVVLGAFALRRRSTR